MKKLLSMLLVIAMVGAFFAGCGKGDPTPTLRPAELPTYDGTVIEFKVYDEKDFQTRWNKATAELLELEYQIKMSYSIPAVEQVDMSSKAARELYTSQISLLFEDSATTPDFMPALKGSSTGDNGVWKTIGQRYLLDFNPFLEEGQMLESYVDWVWGAEGTELGLHTDARAYWEQAKACLEIEDKLYVLPRRENRPIDMFLGYATNNLDRLGYTLETTPTTWDGFVELLTQYKNSVEGSGSIPLVAEQSKASYILNFVASTYGLEFSEGFEWKQKNGEPLWTYYWDEYLEILKDVRSLAESDLIQIDKKAGKGVILNYDFDTKNPQYIMGKAKSTSAYQEATAIAGYNTSLQFGYYSSHGGRGLTGWRVTPRPVMQDGYTYALSGGSMFDGQVQMGHAGGYIAINKTNYELALRLIDYLSAYCNDEGYIEYVMGREGSYFADTWQEAGNYIYDENGKIHWWGETRWGWENEKELFIAYDPRAEIFRNEIDGIKKPSGSGEEGKNYAEEFGIEGSGYFPTGPFSTGINMFADITMYPMKLTAYWNAYGDSWSGEWFAKDEASADSQLAGAVHIYNGMFIDPVQRLGSVTGTDMQNKIDTLSQLAKEFTVDFLSGKRTETAWESYINALNTAGYKDVYNYYRSESYAYVDTYDESVSSQSDVNAKRGV